MTAGSNAGGKSGHHRAGCWITSRRGNATDSATESKPPGSGASSSKVRVKWRGKSSPHSWRQGWHGKPHPVQDQAGFRSQQCGPGAARASWYPGRSLEAVGNDSSREMVIASQEVQNPAYNYSTMKASATNGSLHHF